jgi:hypothetical protein
VTQSQVAPVFAQMRSADRIELHLRLEAKRKTSTRVEYFAFLTQNGNGLRRTFANNLALWHPGGAHTLVDALTAGKINRIVTRYGGAIAAYRKSRIERKSCLRGSPRLALRSE